MTSGRTKKEKIEREIDLNAVGETLLNSNFRELSEHILRMVAEEG